MSRTLEVEVRVAESELETAPVLSRRLADRMQWTAPETAGDEKFVICFNHEEGSPFTDGLAEDHTSRCFRFSFSDPVLSPPVRGNAEIRDYRYEILRAEEATETRCKKGAGKNSPKVRIKP